MRTATFVLAILAGTLLMTAPANANTFPRATLAVANVDGTTSGLGAQVSPPCEVPPCVFVGLPQAVGDVFCPAWGCPFLWQVFGKVHLKIENLATGESCEAFTGGDLDCHHVTLDATLRFTLTAVGDHSESVVVFH